MTQSDESNSVRLIVLYSTKMSELRMFNEKPLRPSPLFEVSNWRPVIDRLSCPKTRLSISLSVINKHIHTSC